MPKFKPLSSPVANRNQKGFTLVEILVVIAILAILSTIVASVGANYQRQARDSVRKRDLRDVQIALKMYFDNKGHYPQQTLAGILGGFIFGCEDDTQIRPGQVWVCTDDQNPVTYMKIYPKDPKPWKPQGWGLAALNYVYIPTYNFGDTTGIPCFNSPTCQGYRLYACLENVSDQSATGPAGGVIVDSPYITCTPDRAPILVSPQ